MSKSTPSPKRKQPLTEQDIPKLAALKQINLNAAGLDIGDDEIYVAVPEGRDTVSVRVFPTFTYDLYALADWLSQCGVGTVAIESTGIYWIPIYEILEERGFEVFLGEDHFQEQARQRALKSLKRKAKQLGFDLVPQAAWFDAVSTPRSYPCRSPARGFVLAPRTLFTAISGLDDAPMPLCARSRHPLSQFVPHKASFLRPRHCPFRVGRQDVSWQPDFFGNSG
jgi:hypothetical protein